MTNNDRRFETVEELLTVAKSIINHNVGEFDINHILSARNKGSVGSVIEQGVFGIKQNSRREPDFKNLGVELKVTGYRRHKNRSDVSAKERLVITMIDYKHEAEIDFYDSDLYHKMAKMLMILYEYEADKDASDFLLTHSFLYDFDKIDPVDREIIIKDWETITNKIKSGNAHLISEADTNYLAACTKGKDSSSLRKQPYGSELAMSRAYSLKNSYLTTVLKQKMSNTLPQTDTFIRSIEDIKRSSLQNLILSSFDSFIGKSLSDIDKQIGEKIKRKGNKQYIASYVSRMLKVADKNLDNIAEFKKANIKIKTIRVKTNDSIKESMSFPAMNFISVSEESWENCELREMFQSTRFLFVVFDEIDDSKYEYTLRGVKLWNMPIVDLENDVKKVWEKTNGILNGSLEIVIKDDMFMSNFPGSRTNSTCHVRPHGNDGFDTSPLPPKCKINLVQGAANERFLDFQRRHVYTKQSFWLNNNYIQKLISDIKKTKAK